LELDAQNGKDFFSFLHNIQTGCGAYLAYYTMCMGEGGGGGVKRQGLETDFSLPSDAEVKRGGALLHSPTRLHEDVWGGVRRHSFMSLNLDTRLGSVVNFTPRELYSHT
jgi:hypothetical protein